MCGEAVQGLSSRGRRIFRCSVRSSGTFPNYVASLAHEGLQQFGDAGRAALHLVEQVAALVRKREVHVPFVMVSHYAADITLAFNGGDDLRGVRRGQAEQPAQFARSEAFVLLQAAEGHGLVEADAVTLFETELELMHGALYVAYSAERVHGLHDLR